MIKCPGAVSLPYLCSKWSHYRYVQSLMDAKLLTINTETLGTESVISLNLK